MGGTKGWVEFGELLAEPLQNGLFRPKKVRGAGIKMVNMGELFAFTRITDQEMERVPFSVEENRYLLSPEDLLFARQSLVREGAGKCSIFLGSQEPVTFEGHLIRARLDTGRADPRFYCYLFESSYGKQIMDSIVEQVAAAGIRQSDLFKLKVPYLPLEQQHHISKVMSTLDDKIELNRRMNATFEGIARALFKSWFVDFDPVRAKLDGRPSGLPSELDTMFTDYFEDSELGKIPGGWTVKEVGEVVDIVGGGTPSTKNPEYWEGGEYAFATPKDLSSLDSPILVKTARKVTGEGLKKISSGLLASGTLLMSSRAPVGYLAITAMPVSINQGFIAMKCNEVVSSFYLLNWAKENLGLIEAASSGTTFPEISKTNFRPLKIVFPGPQILKAFSLMLEPIYSAIETNLRQNQLLLTIQETFLPHVLRME